MPQMDATCMPRAGPRPRFRSRGGGRCRWPRSGRSKCPRLRAAWRAAASAPLHGGCAALMTAASIA
eukprot:468245-Lingulodinium_polyedra.AAC.1